MNDSFFNQLLFFSCSTIRDFRVFSSSSVNRLISASCRSVTNFSSDAPAESFKTTASLFPTDFDLSDSISLAPFCPEPGIGVD